MNLFNKYITTIILICFELTECCAIGSVIKDGCYPQELKTQEILILKADYLAGKAIKESSNHNKKAILENFQKSINLYQWALSLKKRDHQQTNELDKKLNNVFINFFLWQLPQQFERFLPASEDRKQMNELILLFREDCNLLSRLIEIGSSKPEVDRKPLEHFMLAYSYEIRGEVGLAVLNYSLLSEKLSKAFYFEEAGNALKKAYSLSNKASNSLLCAQLLEWVDEKLLQKLIEKLKDSELQNILNKKDVIRMVFEEMLKKIDLASIQEKKPTCFICFTLEEEDVAKWLEHTFVPDLERVGIVPYFCFRNFGQGKDLNFYQAHARTADLVVVVCTPTIKRKCEERKQAPVGVAQEIRLTLERFNDEDKFETIFPIYLKGNRRNACPNVLIEPILGTKFVNEYGILSYYSNAFELYGAMRKTPRKIARQLKNLFIDKIGEIIFSDEIDLAKLEIWRNQKKSSF